MSLFPISMWDLHMASSFFVTHTIWMTCFTDGLGRALFKESLSEAGVRISNLNQKDVERKKTTELKNILKE